MPMGAALRSLCLYPPHAQDLESAANNLPQHFLLTRLLCTIKCFYEEVLVHQRVRKTFDSVELSSCIKDFVELKHEVLNLDSSWTRSCYRQENLQVEFKRISLTWFRSCTRRSRYRSISKQTTRQE
ncbi:hypothetical protein Tco_0037999 [Tanacetum coccineum]